MTPEIILASSSTVRKEVLDQMCFVYSIHLSNFEEKMEKEESENFEDLAKRLALGKARNVASSSRVSNAIIIGADSFAVFNGEILGKPHTKERAIEYLTRLSGRAHDFYTGMAVIDTATKREITDCVKATVHFRTLTKEEIIDYLEREDVTTAAAAYRIQGLGRILVERVGGDYYAVVGLSPSKLTEMLRSLNHNLFDYIPP